MILSENGWLDGVRRIESPNQDVRPPGETIQLLVVHNISLPPDVFTGDGVIELFTNCLDADAHPYYRQIADLRVSAHFFIRRDGELIQFVSCLARAWHAGVSTWRGRSRCNDFSIGIELEGADTLPFEPAQYAMLRELAATLAGRFPIDAIAGHSDIAPGRKTDPGPAFDWSQLSGWSPSRD